MAVHTKPSLTPKLLINFATCPPQFIAVSWMRICSSFDSVFSSIPAHEDNKRRIATMA